MTAVWLSPPFFMALFYLKTTKLDRLFTVSFMAYPIFCILLIVFSDPTILPPPLKIQYMVFGAVMLLLFKRRFAYPQAVSIAFNTIFLNLLYWELPYYVYAIIKRGYVSEAVSLHILPIFSLYFLSSIMKLELKNNLRLLLLGLIVSTSLMLALLAIGIDVLTMTAYLDAEYWAKEAAYCFSRAICLFCLSKVVFAAKLRERI